ncbi:hypothetical protein [Bacillus pumilus]|uniref:hypothetical protein n=1 Tax=Bacillus pumilus TaxID=1408 RepID=UPI003305DFD2
MNLHEYFCEECSERTYIKELRYGHDLYCAFCGQKELSMSGEDMLSLEYGPREAMKQNNKIPMAAAELSLLKVWKSSGIESVYKYKGRIIEFRKGLSDINSIYDVSSFLLYDLSGVMFANVVDIANGNHKNFRLEDFAVRLEDILSEQEHLL